MFPAESDKILLAKPFQQYYLEYHRFFMFFNIYCSPLKSLLYSLIFKNSVLRVADEFSVMQKQNACCLK